MFFWMILASLMGIVMFSNWQEKTKDQENFVVPVYEAMALSTLQQHSAAEKGYSAAIKANQEQTNAYLASFSDGIVPLVTVEDDAMGPVAGASNVIYPFIQSYLPANYKPQNNTRTYMFCIPLHQTGQARCNESGVVKYIITLRMIPQRYEGANKMTVLKTIMKATAHSKFFGLLQKADTALASGTHQPLGSWYYISTAGIAPAGSVYIPNYATCNFPLKNNSETDVLGDALDNTYLVSLSLIDGLDVNQSLASAESPCPLN